MRTLYCLVATASLLLVIVTACQKVKDTPAPASLTVINAMAGSDPIVSRFGDTAFKYYVSVYYDGALIPVSYGNAQQYSQVAGSVPLLVVPSTDTLFKLLDGTFTFASGDIFSLFFAGDKTHVDTFLIKENIMNTTDSSTALRFVNLSVGGKSLYITSQSSGTTEFGPIGYKGATAFKKYSATSMAPGSYIFTIRDQASGDSLTSYEWSYPRFRSQTLVISGSVDPASSTPLTIFPVNNY